VIGSLIGAATKSKASVTFEMRQARRRTRTLCDLSRSTASLSKLTNSSALSESDLALGGDGEGEDWTPLLSSVRQISLTQEEGAAEVSACKGNQKCVLSEP